MLTPMQYGLMVTYALSYSQYCRLQHPFSNVIGLLSCIIYKVMRRYDTIMRVSRYYVGQEVGSGGLLPP